MVFPNPAEGEGTSIAVTTQLQVSNTLDATPVYLGMIGLTLCVSVQASFSCCECEPRNDTDNWTGSA